MELTNLFGNIEIKELLKGNELNGVLYKGKKISMSYTAYDTVQEILEALSYYDCKAIDDTFLKNFSYLYDDSNTNIVGTFALGLKKIQSIKIFKNKRIDINFISGINALEFTKMFLIC